MAKRILILVGDYVEDYEAMVPYQILLMAGHEVITACPGKKAGDTVKTAVHDFEGDQTYSEKPGHLFRLTDDFETVRAEEFDALIIPGGRAPEYLRLDHRVTDLVKHFFAENKPVGALCHGVQILIAAGVLKERELTAYFSLRPDVQAAGGKWVEPAHNAELVHVDGNLVTAVAWPGHPLFMRRFLELLGTRIDRHAAAKTT